MLRVEIGHNYMTGHIGDTQIDNKGYYQTLIKDFIARSTGYDAESALFMCVVKKEGEIDHIIVCDDPTCGQYASTLFFEKEAARKSIKDLYRAARISIP